MWRLLANSKLFLLSSLNITKNVVLNAANTFNGSSNLSPRFVVPSFTGCEYSPSSSTNSDQSRVVMVVGIFIPPRNLLHHHLLAFQHLQSNGLQGE